MAVALGIDLGTTNSVAAVATPTGVEFILGARGERVHPSVVAFPAGGGVVVGSDAKRYRLSEPEHVVHSAKRFLGTLLLDGLPARPRGDLHIEVQFRVDVDGILHVRATDQTSGQQQEAHLQVLGAPVPGAPEAANHTPGGER